MNVFIFLISIIAAVCNNVTLHFLSAKNIKYNPFLFNVGVSLIWLVILLGVGGQGAYTSTTVFYGIVYGIVMAGFLFFKMQAMTTGPILLTSLLGCSSFVITTVFNAVYWKENIAVFGVIGILCMLLALYLTTMKGKSHEETGAEREKTKPIWIIYCVFFLLFSATTGIIFKFHQTYDRANTSKMMIVSAIISAVMFLAVYFLSKAFSKKTQSGKVGAMAEKQVEGVGKTRTFLVGSMLVCGVVSCVYNRLNVYLTGVLPSVLFFPIFNGSVIMLASVAGIFVFKEKLTKRQVVGVCLGLLAILLISNFFGLVQ